MTTTPTFKTIEEAFLYCRDMHAPLADRLAAFSAATRYLLPGYQEAADRIALRLDAYNAGGGAPKPGEMMPGFALPDDHGRMVSLDSLLAVGPVAVTFNRGHWCPYCRINTRALAEAQGLIASEGGQIVAIMPDREKFAAALKVEGTGWDIGHAVRFLLSDHARYITGHTLVVDGGVTLQAPARESAGH